MGGRGGGEWSEGEGEGREEGGGREGGGGGGREEVCYWLLMMVKTLEDSDYNCNTIGVNRILILDTGFNVTPEA